MVTDVWYVMVAARGALWVYPLYCDPWDDLHRAKANPSAAVGTYVRTQIIRREKALSSNPISVGRLKLSPNVKSLLQVQ